MQMLTALQETLAALPRSGSRRTDAELCLLRLSDETLDDSAAGLSARIARLEERFAAGAAAPRPRPQAAPARPAAEQPNGRPGPPAGGGPPPLGRGGAAPAPGAGGGALPARAPGARPAPEAARPAPPGGRPVRRPGRGRGRAGFWPAFVQGLRGKVPPTIMPYLHNPAKVQGVWKNGKLTLWVDGEFTRSMLNKPAILEPMAQAAAAAFGAERPAVSVVAGQPPAEDAAGAGRPRRSGRSATRWTSCWPSGSSLTISSFSKVGKETPRWRKDSTAGASPAWAGA